MLTRQQNSVATAAELLISACDKLRLESELRPVTVIGLRADFGLIRIFGSAFSVAASVIMRSFRRFWLRNKFVFSSRKSEDFTIYNILNNNNSTEYCRQRVYGGRNRIFFIIIISSLQF